MHGAVIFYQSFLQTIDVLTVKWYCVIPSEFISFHVDVFLPVIVQHIDPQFANLFVLSRLHVSELGYD